MWSWASGRFMPIQCTGSCPAYFNKLGILFPFLTYDVGTKIRSGQNMKTSSALLLSVVMLSPAAFATEPATEATPEVAAAEDKMQEVVVAGIKNPELKPYRIMSAGLDAFDEYRKHAPEATLRFRLNKRGQRGPDTNWDDVKLRLVGSETSIPVAIAGDGRFELPRSQEAYDDEADLILNKKKSTIGFTPEVRTPGLARNTRRLGDYRLECQVLMAIGKKEMPFAMRAMFNTYTMGKNWCSVIRDNFSISFPLPDWPISTTLSHDGKRTVIVPRGNQFKAPIQDKSLPDDAIIEFEFWSEASLERKQQIVAQFPINLQSSADKWGPGQPFKPTGNGQYSSVKQLKPGKWQFYLKAPAGVLALGATVAKSELVPGVEQALLWHEYKNLSLNVEQAGSYEFVLDLRDLERPKVSVKRID
jgi:hypothetical protein